jgi:hypothetical protein
MNILPPSGGEVQGRADGKRDALDPRAIER